MTLTEIIPAVRQLPMLDKIRLLRILAKELDAREEHHRGLDGNISVYSVLEWYRTGKEEGADFLWNGTV